MTYKIKCKTLTLLTAAIMVFSPLQPAHAIFGLGDIVYDPVNYGQNLLTAARTLQMINQQAQAFQQRITMLQNMAKNLQQLPFNALPNINQAISQVHLLMQQAGQLSFEVSQARILYQQTYPGIYTAQMTKNDLVQLADKQWVASREAYNHAVMVQSQISQNIVTDQQILSALVDQSQNAVGTVQVTQAGNQMRALAIRQNTDLLQLLASQGRAQSLDQSRRTEAEKIAVARVTHYIGDGNAYTRLP